MSGFGAHFDIFIVSNPKIVIVIVEASFLMPAPEFLKTPAKFHQPISTPPHPPQKKALVNSVDLVKPSQHQPLSNSYTTLCPKGRF